jgi:hypothetical protein
MQQGREVAKRHCAILELSKRYVRDHARGALNFILFASSDRNPIHIQVPEGRSILSINPELGMEIVTILTEIIGGLLVRGYVEGNPEKPLS